jgi:hypothetical protein
MSDPNLSEESQVGLKLIFELWPKLSGLKSLTYWRKALNIRMLYFFSLQFHRRTFDSTIDCMVYATTNMEKLYITETG